MLQSPENGPRCGYRTKGEAIPSSPALGLGREPLPAGLWDPEVFGSWGPGVLGS